MALEKQRVNIAAVVYHAILTDWNSAPGKAHSRQSIVLRDNNVAGTQHVDKREIHAVRAL